MLERLVEIIFTAGVIFPTVSPLELAWLLVGAFANMRAWTAMQDAAGDVRVSIGPPPLSELQQEQASGHHRTIRHLWLCVASLEAIGVASAFSPPPTAVSGQQITIAAIVSAPLAIIANLSLTFAVNTIVQSRERWRRLYRAQRRAQQ
jgi:hypothetical protein